MQISLMKFCLKNNNLIRYIMMYSRYFLLTERFYGLSSSSLRCIDFRSTAHKSGALTIGLNGVLNINKNKEGNVLFNDALNTFYLQ